jgi:hypothetical protein
VRGLTPAGAEALGRSGVPIHIVPPEPEDPFHTRAAAEALAVAVPGARLTPGFPVPPSPRFAEARVAFSSLLLDVLGQSRP